MAEVLLFDEAIRYWALIPLAVGVVLAGALRYFVSELVRSSQSAEIVKEGLSSSLSLSLVYAGELFRLVATRARNLLPGENFIPAKSFRPNELTSMLLHSVKPFRYLAPQLEVENIGSILYFIFKAIGEATKSEFSRQPILEKIVLSGNHPEMVNTQLALPRRQLPLTLLSRHGMQWLASWNGNDNGLIVRHDGFHVFTVFNRTADFQPVNLNFGFDRKPDLVMGPCDGIFCLYWGPTKYDSAPVVPRVERLPTIALWNPATRAFSILPKSRFDFPPYKKVSCCLVGFGFDLTTKSIKVVKVVSFCTDEAPPNDYLNCAEVYDLGSGSWRVLDVDDILQEVYVFDEHSMYNNNDGVFHWCSVFRAINLDEDYVEVVLSFDMSRELFQVTPKPEKYNIHNRLWNYIRKQCHFSLLRDSLAANLSFFKESHTTVELWVMKKDSDRVVEAGVSFSSYSWSHELTVELSHPWPCVLMGFWSKNELLIWKTDWTGGTPFLYDIVAKQARDLQLSGELNFLYKESLVSVKGGCGSDSIQLDMDERGEEEWGEEEREEEPEEKVEAEKGEGEEEGRVEEEKGEKVEGGKGEGEMVEEEEEEEEMGKGVGEEVEKVAVGIKQGCYHRYLGNWGRHGHGS
ncbi:hypothetical protein RHSIM_Rhsim07G0218800 [Rhododendron simsii]|uniref:F-box associated beta-propeller type 1 domain-containing protein n=1 Tax=Rhododendron simsii TaxID=118357 RepID=A0A834LIL2_RHOSS|nr:hypothetical protein RHSIM_Rhsim07G0218800 [Rhododendron simsii]